MKYLVDSNIIIYHLNGDEKATEFLRNNHHRIALSQITYVEVLSFPYTLQEEDKIKQFLSTFILLDVNNVISDIAIENRKIKKIKLPDNLIASTAIAYGLSLVTHNTRDFSGLNLSLVDLF